MPVGVSDLKQISGAGFGTLYTYDGLLGNDFLTAHAAHLDLAAETLYVRPPHAEAAALLAGTWVCDEDANETLTVAGPDAILAGPKGATAYSLAVSDDLTVTLAGREMDLVNLGLLRGFAGESVKITDLA